MKVAICFSGLVRTFEECFPTYDRILNLYDCDLFGASPPNDVLGKYPFTKLVIQEDTWIDEKWWNNCKNPETIIQNSLRQIRFIELSNNARLEHEIEAGTKYDFIIRTRFDNILINDIPDLANCDPNSIYIPEGHDHPLAILGSGINDRFAFGGNHVMNVYCNRLSVIDEYMNKGLRFHPETILRWVLQKNDLRIIRFAECSKINRGNNELL